MWAKHFGVWPEQLDEMDLNQVAWMTARLREYIANPEEFINSHISFLDDELRDPAEANLDTYDGPRFDLSGVASGEQG